MQIHASELLSNHVGRGASLFEVASCSQEEYGLAAGGVEDAGASIANCPIRKELGYVRRGKESAASFPGLNGVYDAGWHA